MKGSHSKHPDEKTNSNFLLLRFIAKNGICNRNFLGNKGETNLSTRQVARRINELEYDGYVQVVAKRLYRHSKKKNVPDKYEKLYGLTFKGLLASLHVVSLEKNYIFKEYLSLIDDDLKPLVIKFLKNYILEFFIYHEQLGIKLSDINNLETYIREIIYDHNLVDYDQQSNSILKTLYDEVALIDEIHDGITSLQNPEFEQIKHEFLINFWSDTLYAISNESDIESELELLLNDENPFGLTRSTEDIFREHKTKMIQIDEQWSHRKLNFFNVTSDGKTVTIGDVTKSLFP